MILQQQVSLLPHGRSCSLCSLFCSLFCAFQNSRMAFSKRPSFSLKQSQDAALLFLIAKVKSFQLTMTASRKAKKMRDIRHA
jgi:hypothetical protein